MKLPFADDKLGFERLPGNRAACVGAFKRDEFEELLKNSGPKVLATAARFLQVPETEIVQMLSTSTHLVSVVFMAKEYDLYDWDDADD